MDFYWAGLFFWVLIVVGILLLAFGIWKKSWQVLLISGIAFLPPMIYFGGAENWFKLLALVPLIPFTLSYFTKKKVKSN